MKTLTILTPTFNRKKELLYLYNSLIKQTSLDFVWIIIDDGSNDDTISMIKKMRTKKFDIEYVYKDNGGKHTALNVGFSMLNTELVGIVDSDDSLTPDAVETIVYYWKKYKCNDKISGLVFKKSHNNGKDITEKFKKKEFVDNYNKYIINNKIKGDKFEIFKSEIISKYRYPEFKGEKFCGEGVLWSKISRNYDMVFVDKSIYLCEYLNGGLTNSGRKMRLMNPLGGMFHSSEYLDTQYSVKVRIKNAILYLIYGFFAKKNIIKIIKNSKNKIILILCLPISYVIYKNWRKKYFS